MKHLPVKRIGAYTASTFKDTLISSILPCFVYFSPNHPFPSKAFAGTHIQLQCGFCSLAATLILLGRFVGMLKGYYYHMVFRAATHEANKLLENAERKKNTAICCSR